MGCEIDPLGEARLDSLAKPPEAGARREHVQCVAPVLLFENIPRVWFRRPHVHIPRSSFSALAPRAISSTTVLYSVISDIAFGYATRLLRL